MPIPATAGQKRTNVSDMQIGDYIICEYWQNKAGSTGSLSLLGTATRGEIPITGMTTATTSENGGTFYFVKVDKGLLIGDRVVQHSISWDALNTGRLIQGLPWNNGNIIPVMTGNTAPSGIASASSSLSNTPPWHSFDESIATAWHSASAPLPTSPEWIVYEFTKPKIVKRYDILAYSSADPARPKVWTFEGSNDGTTWDVLDRKSNRTWTDKMEVVIDNKTAYKKYRIHITERVGTNTYVRIGDIRMYEVAGIIRSLTGGVAYVDANGAMSTTDKGLGCWPVNNEWDKYIVSFPQDLIQSGKTYRDIFNTDLNVVTWCQDTPTNGMSHPAGGQPNPSSNIGRVHRGLAESTDGLTTEFAWATSTWIGLSMGINQGFRPVFEYREV
ncbi:discoidin domain-containing protein [Brevibacillus sp. MER 51]|uniref:discoidin domain-containing protein n=1 Tax=Brevibacillus sp. MER 51 TaxID=2939560 RepID=UPI00203DF261|nr:discoidin domain-containing protein [Brevibacillus sp. MER 51]MCM3144579.1 discoidin domain-containing protein [Brevibacillus sp. MER 51]